MKKRKKKAPFVDDGRVVANMNVEGMPWYSGVPETTAQQKNEKTEQPIELTGREKAAMMRGVMAATLLVAVVFVGVFALFILFCVYVWFR